MWTYGHWENWLFVFVFVIIIGILFDSIIVLLNCIFSYLQLSGMRPKMEGVDCVPLRPNKVLIQIQSQVAYHLDYRVNNP